MTASLPPALYDLHTHSTASDGWLSPAALVTAACQKGVATLALTDHDTIAGLDEAQATATKQGIRFIPGVEIEVTPRATPTPVDAEEREYAARREFHLLGLGFDQTNTAFLALLDDLRASREERNEKMFAKMRDMGIPTDESEIRAIAGGGFLGRPHFAEYLVRKGIVKNYETAFKKYLAKGEVLFVPREGADFMRAVELIHGAGGLAFVAHPTSLYISWGHMASFLPRARDAGLDGIEAWHPNASVHESERLVALAREAGLCISAGSDYHGEGRRDRHLGMAGGDTKIVASLLDFTPLAPERVVFSESLRALIAGLPNC
jgi:predicted metal-dependent phosphoesterase TrpH